MYVSLTKLIKLRLSKAIHSSLYALARESYESSPLQAAVRKIICLIYSDVQLTPVLLWAIGLCLIVAE